MEYRNRKSGGSKAMLLLTGLIWGVALIGVLIMNFILDKRRTQKLSKTS